MSCEAARQRDWQENKRVVQRAQAAIEMPPLPPAPTGIIGAGDAATDLHRLTGKALQAMEYIFDIPYPPRDDPSFVKIMAEKRQTASAILAGQIRVDENMLRHRSDDMLERLLATVEQKVAKQRLVS